MIKWMYLLAALNFMDGIATYAGMKAFLIEEANPLLASMSPGFIIIMKLALSLALLFLAKRADLAKPIFKICIGVGNGVYLMIAVLHIYWISIVIA
ncbi:DUF5658 family protein [Neobacillus sp. YIM B06451]|uniref:DUF5658 family protein n=1 Tax=Neobacillus sp. YIM B06451 TaxID=3070994 RepID=UPI0029310B72|nr:DUF5658 family protein [Neobacillus sp. YIM B06451]